jgi:hypothetical protein
VKLHLAGFGQPAEGRLRAFDATGKEGFALHKGPYEQMRIGQPPSLAGQASKQLIRIG